MSQGELFAMLRCPEDRSALAPASEALVSQLNAVIRQRRLVNRGGKRIEQCFDGGLIRADGAVLYPIVEGIPVLLKDEAIRLGEQGVGE